MRLSARGSAAAPGVSRRLRARARGARGRACSARRCVVGFPGTRRTARCYNALAVLARRPRDAVYRKQQPARTTRCSTRSAISSPGSAPCVFDVDGTRVGLLICEDVWFPGPGAAGEGGRRAGWSSSPTARRTTRGSRRCGARRSARGRARPACPSSTSIASAARTSSCSTAPRSSSTRDGEVVQQLPAWHETVALVDARRRRAEAGARLARSRGSSTTSTRRW